MTVRHQAGGRGQAPKIHARSEYMNVLCECVKRSDLINRRFVQHFSMRANNECLLVRSAKTGRILVKPPEERLWIVGDKAGMVRASRSELEVRKSVGDDLFEVLGGVKAKDWQSGRNWYYDVTVWDLVPGRTSSWVYTNV